MLFDYIKIAIEIIGCMWITSLYFWMNGNLLASGRCGTVFKPDFQTYCILIYWTVPMELLSIKWATYQIRQLRIVRAPGMPRTFSLPPTSKETTSKRSRHASRHVRDARAVMHVGIANPRWREKRSKHSRRMRNPQFYVSGKRPMPTVLTYDQCILDQVIAQCRQSTS